MDYENSTVSVYDRNALDYQSRQTTQFQEKERKKFLESIPNRGKILDLGCGPGNDSLFFHKSGYKVLAIDGAVGMVDLAKSKGLNAMVMKYSEVNNLTDKYDGIWASYSLLHVPKNEISSILRKIKQLLKPNGKLYASFRLGKGEELRIKDRYDGGRYFSYYHDDELMKIFSEIFKDVRIGHVDATDEKGGICVWARN